MRPLTAVTLIIMGSCFSIALSLAGVLVVVLVLGDEYPRLQREFDPLLTSFVLFVVMTAVSAASFYSLIKKHRMRFWAQGAMWSGLLVTGAYYWP